MPCHRHLIIVSIIIVFPLTLLMASKLSWSVSPRLSQAEIEGVAHPDGQSFFDLCSPDLMQGLRGLNSNVQGRASTFALYMIPTKVFYGRFDVFSIRRVINILLYAITLFLLALAMIEMAIPFPVCAACLLYFGLNFQFVSLLLGNFPNLTGTAWVALIFALFAFMQNNRHRASRFMPTIALFPAVVASAYEVYVECRAFACIVWPFVLLWLLFDPKIKRRHLPVAVFLSSTICAIGILSYVIHPDLKLNLALFHARESETIFGPSGELSGYALELMGRRLKEFKFLFNSSDQALVVNEDYRFPFNIGWLEILVPLMCSFGVYGILALRQRTIGKPAFWNISLCSIFIGVSFVANLGSNFEVRSYRLFALYEASILMLAIVSSMCIVKGGKIFRQIVYILSSVVAIYCLYVRVPIIARWTYPLDQETSDFVQITEKLAHFALNERIIPAKEGVEVFICDHRGMNENLYPILKLFPGYEGGFWHSALYASGFACKFNISSVKYCCECKSFCQKHNGPVQQIHLDRPSSTGNEMALKYPICHEK